MPLLAFYLHCLALVVESSSLSPMLSPKIGLKLRFCISCFELQLSLWLNICGINEAISEGSGQIIFSYMLFLLFMSFLWLVVDIIIVLFILVPKSHRFEEVWVNSYKQQIDTFIFHSETLLFKNHMIVILKGIKKIHNIIYLTLVKHKWTNIVTLVICYDIFVVFIDFLI